ncbi:glycosyltransferase family 2 protein [Microbacterium laevaniformans]|uniref:glycosyltransferase family 2 protein n=1 Tax=Microbacterium laevaniformans TaxID=36807 RepID=UPI003640EEA5
MEHDGFDLDVLVLDDASPEPGFGDYLAELSERTGATYYRTPRNLGIPRNVNLGLATAQKLEYDYVVISNSDVIYSKNSVSVLLEACAGTTTSRQRRHGRPTSNRTRCPAVWNCIRRSRTSPISSEPPSTTVSGRRRSTFPPASRSP